MRALLLLAAGTALAVLAAPAPAAAQTDEIQVYNGEINEPGQFSITLHNNFTPVGRTRADLPGGIVPQGSLNGVPEYALGVTDWLELGAYLPLYSVTRDGRFRLNGGKLRVLFAEPHVARRRFFYAVNFEFSYNALHWAATRYSSEIRPIVGARFGRFDVIANPILDNSFTTLGLLDFAPAIRVDYNLPHAWSVAVEHYADFGPIRRLSGLNQQEQTLFAVVDHNGRPLDFEAGIGHGFTAASDALVLKLMVTATFGGSRPSRPPPAAPVTRDSSPARVSPDTAGGTPPPGRMPTRG